MKTTPGILIGSLVLCSLVPSSLVPSSAALADTAGPDFVGAAPRRHIDHSLVASSGTNRIDPADIVSFATDKADLTDSGFAQVDRASRWLRKHPRQHIVLEGHTDLPGSVAYNDELAVRRIESVRQRLRRDGVANQQIIMIRYGEHESIDSPPDRRVRMFTTDMSPEAVLAMAGNDRDIVAYWQDRGQMMRLHRGMVGGAQPVPTTARR